MSLKNGLILGLCFGLWLQAIPTAAGNAPRTLRVYGPGGPHQVLQKCAETFGARNNLEVVVLRALPFDLERKLAEDGDLYYGGAEYMLDDFHRRNPGVLAAETTKKLHPRRIGILVRKGNPLNIRGLEDLAREEIDLLDVKLEKMRHFYGPAPDRTRNVRHWVFTGRQGYQAWQDFPEIDAWVTYRSWHVLLRDQSDFIEIPEERALRYTPIAVTRRTGLRREALEFIDFLKSEEAHRIFRDHGWD